MKTDRLFGIVHVLLRKGKVTARELAETFEVSVRTIYRDVETLSINGIPIYTDQGAGGGIGLLDTYVLNRALISKEDRSRLLLGLDLLRATQFERKDTAIEKLKTLFDPGQTRGENEHYVEIDFSRFDAPIERKAFDAIKLGLQGSRRLKLHYINDSGTQTVREIDPLKLVFKNQRWYLVAFCHYRETYRTFRVSRMREVALTDVVFDRSVYNLEAWTMTSYAHSKAVEVTLTLDARAAYRVEEEFFSDMVTPCNHKGRDALAVRFSSELDAWIVNYILTYAEDLLAVAPSELRESVREKAQKILDQI